MHTYMKISTLSQLTIATECLQRQLEQWDISAEKKMDIRLCVMEAVQNGLLYGSAEGQPPEVHLSWQCNCDGFSFFVEDNGSGVPERLRSGKGSGVLLDEHGRGILLMHVLLDEVIFNERGNRITGRMKW